MFALGSVVLVSALATLGALQPLEWMTYDARMRVFNADKAAPPNISVVLIDEASLQYMNHDAGRWPWPRSVHGDLLDFLSRGKPRAVVFDVLFVENQRDLGATTGLSAHDERLIDATVQTGAVIHAMQLLADSADDRSVRTTQPTLPDAFTQKFALDNHLRIDHESATSAPLPYNDFEIPFDGLWQAAGGIGVVRADPDHDGRYRRMQLLHTYNTQIFPSLAFAPVLDALHARELRVTPDDIAIDGRAIPLDRDGRMLVNQYGTFRAYSYGGIIASLKQLDEGDVEHLIVRPEEFTDNIVFIGASAVGVQDLKATPLSANTAGVYLQASVTGNLLTDDVLQPASGPTMLLISVALAAIGACGALALRQISLKLALLLATLAIYSGVAIFSFRYRIVIDMVAPMMCAFFAWFSAFSYLFFTEGKDKRRVRNVLAQYVSPAVLAEVVDKYESYLAAEIGSKETISVLFSDIRGFTTVSESLTPEKVVEMLNIYFSAMTDVIFAQQGTIDKFIGDAIMAFWGAPIRNEQHAMRAVRAALEMTHALPGVNVKLAEHGIAPLAIGVGINTGEAVLGNIGSKKKLAYTAIGDNVNLASRLEGLTKPYGCGVLIGENTYAHIGADVPCRLIDMVRVKGKSQSIRIYAPLHCTTEAELSAARELCARTDTAFERYLQRDWPGAIALYQQLPHDRVRDIFISRCTEYLHHPPGAEWDGGFTLTSK